MKFLFRNLGVYVVLYFKVCVCVSQSVRGLSQSRSVGICVDILPLQSLDESLLPLTNLLRSLRYLSSTVIGNILKNKLCFLL